MGAQTTIFLCCSVDFSGVCAASVCGQGTKLYGSTG